MEKLFKYWLLLLPVVLALNIGFIAVVVYVVKLIWSL